MEFIIEWLWYVLAFAAGSVLAWLISLLAVRHGSREDALADLPGSREIGAR